MAAAVASTGSASEGELPRLTDARGLLARAICCKLISAVPLAFHAAFLDHAAALPFQIISFVYLCLNSSAALDRPSAAPAPTVMPVVRRGGEVFNPSLLKYYYQNFFPFRLMHKWLSYDNGEYKRLGCAAYAKLSCAASMRSWKSKTYLRACRLPRRSPSPCRRPLKDRTGQQTKLLLPPRVHLHPRERSLRPLPLLPQRGRARARDAVAHA
jgi:hypothetical protein